MAEEHPEAPAPRLRVRDVVHVVVAPGAPERVVASGDAPALLVVLRGRVKVTEREIVVAELAPRDVLFAPAPRTELRVAASAPEARLVAGRCERVAADATVHLRAEHLAGRPALRALLDALDAELALGAPDARAIAALLEATSTHLTRTSTPALDPQVLRVVLAVRREPGRSWTLDGLARVAGLSRAALVRRLRRALGTAPLAFVQEERMRRAAERLSLSEEGLAEIASDVGYASEFAFAKAFKRRFGVAPGLFRRRQRAQLGSMRPTMRVRAA